MTAHWASLCALATMVRLRGTCKSTLPLKFFSEGSLFSLKIPELVFLGEFGWLRCRDPAPKKIPLLNHPPEFTSHQNNDFCLPLFILGVWHSGCVLAHEVQAILVTKLYTFPHPASHAQRQSLVCKRQLVSPLIEDLLQDDLFDRTAATALCRTSECSLRPTGRWEWWMRCKML